MATTTHSALAFTAGLLFATLTFAADPPAAAPAGAANGEGLVEVRVRGLQQYLVQPDADLARYRAIMLDPVEVSFDRRWEPRPAGRELTVEEKTKLRADVARVVQKEFISELSGGGYRIVTEPGDDVLRVRAEIRNLYLNAPDVQRSSRTQTFTRSAGELTLVAELRDSASGALIARALDRYEDPEDFWFQPTTSIDNNQAVGDAAESWARGLRSQLDKARAVKPARGLEPKPR
jgi:hypothetical protein